MTRIPPVDPTQTTGKTHDTLASVGKTLGVIPNLYKVIARSPAALAAFTGMSAGIAQGTFGPRLRHAIALAVAEIDGCDYCLSAHTLLGRGAGLSDHDLELARGAKATDAKTAALLELARVVVVQRGRAGDVELAAVRAAGATDAEILELIANVVVNLLTNYVNLVADTEIDFPVVRGKAA